MSLKIRSMPLVSGGSSGGGPSNASGCMNPVRHRGGPLVEIVRGRLCDVDRLDEATDDEVTDACQFVEARDKPSTFSKPDMGVPPRREERPNRGIRQ